MRKSLTRAAAVAAAGAAATLALAGPANAAVAAPRAHTTLSIVEQRSVIKAGQKDLVSGRLSAGTAGLPREFVVLGRVVSGRFVPVQSGRTNGAGAVTFAVAPRATTRYELAFAGTAKLAPSHSGIVTVRVIP